MLRNLSRVALLAVLSCGALAAAPARCEDLAKLTLPATTIRSAEPVQRGSFTPPAGKPIPDLPAFCRLTGAIKPSDDSDIEFEVWLPSSNWNGKFQGIGNGGFAGAIGYGPMAAALSHGYATASTDTGHQAGGTDASWALGHPQKVIDFGYRAIHETADKAKTIIRAYYGETSHRSYFSSCSNGGRQALMEAQRFPADYDGIIAGAPANNWTHLLGGGMSGVVAMLADPESYIPPSKLPAIESAALAACDALDGVKDGVIDDPTKCHFNPRTLLCQGPDSDSCLTRPQVDTLEKIYSGPRSAKGEQVFPGYVPGGETGPGGWTAWITGATRAKSLGYAFGVNFFQNMVFSSPAWDYRTYNLEHDMKVADDSLARILNSTDPDLKRFKDRGGKLILYHGWSDAAIPAVGTINYYNSVVLKMGAKDTTSFVRLFMAPGMQHCGGGPGPNSFGQGSVTGGDPQHDIDAALERWVQQGIAPERIIATKFNNAADPASGVARTRPLCKYPQIAQWTGSGSTDDASNFICVQPGSSGSK